MTRRNRRSTTLLVQAGQRKQSRAATTPTKEAVASSDNNHNGKLVSEADIRLCAHQKWEAAGKPVSDGVPFWLEAEQELNRSR